MWGPGHEIHTAFCSLPAPAQCQRLFYCSTARSTVARPVGVAAQQHSTCWWKQVPQLACTLWWKMKQQPRPPHWHKHTRQQRFPWQLVLKALVVAAQRASEPAHQPSPAQPSQPSQSAMQNRQCTNPWSPSMTIPAARRTPEVHSIGLHPATYLQNARLPTNSDGAARGAMLAVPAAQGAAAVAGDTSRQQLKHLVGRVDAAARRQNLFWAHPGGVTTCAGRISSSTMRVRPAALCVSLLCTLRMAPTINCTETTAAAISPACKE